MMAFTQMMFDNAYTDSDFTKLITVCKMCIEKAYNISNDSPNKWIELTENNLLSSQEFDFYTN